MYDRKNEEAVIGRCLESVQGMVDEIIIVDTGSEDRTKEIVERYTDKIYDFSWRDDFAAAGTILFLWHPEILSCGWMRMM